MTETEGTPHRTVARPTLAGVLKHSAPLYLLPKDDVAEVVISPALGCCHSADVMIGFFASQSLAEIAAGLARYLRSTVEPLRIIVSPFLTAQDQAILNANANGNVIEAMAISKFADVLPDADELAQHTLECLAWLVSLGRLELKFALMRDALFHPKVWLFKENGNVAALHGSANMTGAGLGRNREQLSLARAWTSSDAYITCKRLVEEFEMLWSGGDGDCVVVDLPRALKERLIADYKFDQMPSEEEYHRLWSKAHSQLGVEPVVGTIDKQAGFAIPAWLNYQSGDFSHQGVAVEAWQESKWRGILEMCTGSGKTLTAMVGAHRLHETVAPLLIVVSAPYKVLLQQWSDEVAAFGVDPINLSEEVGPKGREQAMANARRRLRFGITTVEVLVVSNDTLCTDDFIKQVSQFDHAKLLIADECHNLGAAGFIERPPQCFDYRLGLSATPIRQYDDVGSGALVDFFGPVCFSFRLEDAIGRCLTPYDYFAHFVSLSETEMAEWRDLSEQIARLAWKIDAGVTDRRLNMLLLNRRRVLETAGAKLDKLAELLDHEDLRELRYTLIYATDKAPEQLNAVNALLNNRNILFHQLTAEETSSAELSRRIIERFRAGGLQVLTAKRVLDEGVNIPQIQRAYILASTTVRRQWIQRRGRLLRVCKEIGKTHAVIHDLVALPPEAYQGGEMDSEAKKIVNAELDRVWEFSRLSQNGAQTDGPFAKVEELKALLMERR